MPSGVSKAALKSGVIVILGVWATPNASIGVAGGIVCFPCWLALHLELDL